MKKIFLVFIFLISFSILLLPTHPAQAFMSLVDNVDNLCLTKGDCNVCDVLQVIVNFGKFIFVTMAGLVMLFFMWQAIGLIMNWGNAEAIKTAMDKIKSTLLAALIILAAYLLVSLLINLYSGNSFQTLIKGQISANWNIGPICKERGPRPSSSSGEGIDTSGVVNSLGCGIDAGKDCSCNQDTPRNGCDCGGLNYKVAQCKDASFQLENLLECIKKANSKRVEDGKNALHFMITSISDSAGLARCRDNYSQPPCAHTSGSCHYGGPYKNPNGSFAADFEVNETMKGYWDPGLKDEYKAMVNACNGYFIDWKDEQNQKGTGETVTPHFHISDPQACSGY
ncbi:hypothetical protein GYA13_00895 [Candidatus Kuenenbacteria bacterium]|nr:hypothetical protein [Candidatus Kuenenbacteria bacterium]